MNYATLHKYIFGFSNPVLPPAFILVFSLNRFVNRPAASLYLNESIRYGKRTE